MIDYTNENRKIIKLLGGAEKIKFDFRNDKKLVINLSRILKQIKRDENGMEMKSGKKFNEMKNIAGDSLSTLKRQNTNWTEEKK